MNKAGSIALATLMIVLWATGGALAGNALATPEIDGPTISAGLGLLAAGVLLVRSTRRK
jgi:hypothetical protein